MVDNCVVVYANLPHKVRGFAVHNGAEDFYTIVLNSRKSYEQNKLTFKHELKHIINNDFYKYNDVDLIESLRH